MKMNLAACSLLIGVTLTCAEAQEKAWTESQSLHDLKLEVAEVTPSGSITVRISNASEKPIRLWEDSNSWGAAHWRVLLLRDGRLDAFFQEVDYSFTKNAPDVVVIAGGTHIEKKLDLNGGEWRGLGGKTVGFEPSDTVVVVYDVPATPEARDLAAAYHGVRSQRALANEVRGLSVWYGVAAAYVTVR
jgi:hypothetical protein